MAKTRKIGQHEDHDGLQIKNFLLWLLTTAQTVTKLVSAGHIGFDYQKDKVHVKTSTDLRELAYVELQHEINTSSVIDDDYNRSEVFIASSSPVTLTVNSVSDNFQCQFYNIGTAPVTFAAGTATLSTPDGTILNQDKVATLIKRNLTSRVYLKGELAS